LSAASARKLLSFILIVATVGLLGAFSLSAGSLVSDLLQTMENRSWDLRVRASLRPEQADKRIKLILIDQSSLTHFGREQSLPWPWPREFYAKVVRYLEAAGAKGVAFDMLFTEPSNFGVDDDLLFAQTLGSSMPIVLPVALQRSTQPIDASRLAKFKERYQESSILERVKELTQIASSSAEYHSVVLPIDELVRTLRVPANVSVSPDNDGVFRRFTPAARYAEFIIPALPLALYAATETDATEWRKATNYLANQRELVVRFHGEAGTYPAYSMAAVLESGAALEQGRTPDLSPEVFKDALVLVGVAAPGLFDYKATTVSENLLGVDFLAAVLDNILHRSFVTKTSLWQSIGLVLLLVALATATTLFLLHTGLQLLLLISVFSFYSWLVTWAAGQGVWLPLIIPLVCLLLSALLGYWAHYQIEGKAHRFIKGAFKQYLSAEVIEQIVKHPERLGLSGERRELTVFLSDLQGFAALSEQLGPTELSKLLNEYLSAMTDLILFHGGTVDKYIGDAILCFWNAPLAVEDHAYRAVIAALDCDACVQRLQSEWKERFGVQVSARIGINTGSAVVGNFGSAQRFDYTAIGDTVNLASRLEGVNKVFGTSILISGSTHSELKQQLPCRRVGAVQVMGKREAVEIYQPVQSGESPIFSEVDYSEALELFEEGQFVAARAIFARLSAVDSVSQAYLNRVDQLLLSGGGTPLWNAVWILESK